MRGRKGTTPSQGLTLPLRFIHRKRLKEPMEVTERRQVGDVESTVNAPPKSSSSGSTGRGDDNEF
jgi:hypothetical protein